MNFHISALDFGIDQGGVDEDLTAGHHIVYELLQGGQVHGDEYIGVGNDGAADRHVGQDHAAVGGAAAHFGAIGGKPRDLLVLNFSVTYEEWGEAKTVSGVFVCEYAGRSFTLEGGDFRRSWEGHVEGVENLHETFYATVCIGETDDGGEILLNLGVFAAHFMGEPDFADSVIEPSLYIVHSSEDNLSSEFSDAPEELEGVYGLKIIDYHYDEPIENTFK